MKVAKYTFSSNLKDKNIERIFDALILEKGIYVANGCYMFRTDAFKEVNPEMEIIASSGGQNWQILIPISFKYKCGYIDECLFNYRESDDSHSHAITRSFMQELARYREHKQLLLTILSNLDIDLAKYEKMIDKKYLIRNMEICISHNKFTSFREYYSEYTKKYGYNLKYLFFRLFGISIITKKLRLFIRRLRSK
jgi:hypothetical protein